MTATTHEKPGPPPPQRRLSQAWPALALAAALLLLASMAHALPKDLRFQRISREQGLSQASILCSVQGPQGFLWFGTYNGLNRYDGYDFKVYRNDAEDPSSLANNVVRDLLVDDSGTLWVATGGGGLDRYDTDSDSFTHYRHVPDDPTSISNDEVLSLFQDSKGVIWVGTAHGLNAFAPDSGFQRYLPDPERHDSLLGSSVLSVTEDGQGRLWVGTDEGLNRMLPTDQGFLNFKHIPRTPDGLPQGAIHALLPEKGGALWIGASEGGLSRLDLLSGRFSSFLPDLRVMDIFKDSRGILWVGTDQGLGRRVFERDPVSGDLSEGFKLYQHNPFDTSSLSHNDVYTLMEDRSNLLWIGTYGDGVCKLNPVFQEFRLLRQEPWNPESISGRRIGAVLQDTSGALWLGTTYGGLNRVNLETGAVRVFQPDPKDPYSFPSQEIRDLALDPDGDIWVGTADAGVLRMDPRSGAFRQYSHVSDDPYTLSSDNVYAIYNDGKGSLWVGTSKAGLNRLDTSTGTVTRYPPRPDDPGGLSHARVRAILGHAGFLWLGTNNGLNRLDVSNGEFRRWVHDPADAGSISAARVTALLPGPTPETLWVGTHKGLDLFDTRTETFTHFTRRQGYDFANESVADMLQDDLGRLWVSTFGGISRFDPRSGQVRNYTPADGLQGYEFLDNSAFRNTLGELFFGGINGLTWFDPDRITSNTHVPPVVLTEVRVMNKPLVSRHNVTILDSLQLQPHQDFFSFDFAALDFVNPEQNAYAYMLEGFDRDWVNAGSTHSASYTNIDPGTYSFKVRAANSDGFWNNQGLLLQLEILPPYWGQTWFRTLAVLVILTVGWLIYGHRVRRIKREQLQLESQVHERTSQLERTYGQLKAIMNNSPSAIALKDGQGRYTLFNPQFERFFSTHAEVAQFKTDEMIFDRPTADLLTAADQNVWHSGQPSVFELQYDGRTYMMQRFPLRDEAGAPYAICGIATDISQRKETEDALKTSEARYKALTANFPEGLVGLFDRSLRFNLVDGAELAALGLSKQGVQGRTIFEIFPPEICRQLEGAFRQALEGRMNSLELQYMGRDFDIRTLPIVNEQGQVLAGMIVAHNVTARNEAEKARIESEQIYRSIAELSPDAVFVHGACGILFANKAAASLLGAENTNELLGRSMLSLVQDEEKPALQELFDQARQSRQPSRLSEVQLTASEGRLLQVEMATVPITYMEDPALLTIGRDITEKKRLMAETMRSAQLASLGELAAGVAHEINNPINGIINFAELIRDDPKKQLTYEDLPERIIAQSERIAGIVRTLLSFSRGQEESASVFALDSALGDALRLSQNQMEKDGIAIHAHIDANLPKVHGRANELQQVCINLLSNARAAINARHAEAGDKRLDISLHAAQSGNKTMVRLVIEDNGVGMEPHVMERMFEPFYSTKPRNEGTGLGLSISHRIIQDHGGRIHYESEPGHGTKAIVELPAWSSGR